MSAWKDLSTFFSTNWIVVFKTQFGSLVAARKDLGTFLRARITIFAAQLVALVATLKYFCTFLIAFDVIICYKRTLILFRKIALFTNVIHDFFALLVSVFTFVAFVGTLVIAKGSRSNASKN